MPRRARRPLILGAVLVVLLGLVALLPVRRLLVTFLSDDYGGGLPGQPMVPTIEGLDAARARIAIRLTRIADGLPQPTDIQFPPGRSDMAVVLSKTGTAHWLEIESGFHGRLLEIEVEIDSEEGLLGLAFHPRFASNGRVFMNYVAADGSRDITRIEEWRLSKPGDLRATQAKPVRMLMTLEQPYQNHNAGQLVFGPDGMFYVGFGDGGFANDPHGHGQNPRTWLGSMLRIDVDRRVGDEPYAVPRDNPFLGEPGFAPETWAYGLRNPWRYTFDPDGRMIVADVGQDAWEEIDVVRAGDNLGWSLREGFACLRRDDAERCKRSDLVDPVLAYGKQDGGSITGGFVYTGARIPALRGLYVYGDFLSGRLWALKVPDDRTQRVEHPIALGKWPLMPSTFGRDANGELYVGSFATSEIYRIDPAN